MEEKLFYLVEKILKRLNLSSEQLPPNLIVWQDFLSRINRGFLDFEQERYLLERSMEISSREMLELNEQFERAQITAKIGLWIYDRMEDKTVWSKETYHLFGLNPAFAAPKYDDIMLLVNAEDRPKLSKLIETAFSEDKGYEVEFRITNTEDNKSHWLYSKGEVQKQNDPSLPPRYFSGIVMDITERKQSEKRLKQLQNKLLLSARQAGMSEIATSVLHNIGNILNSVNVSISLIKEQLDASKTTYLVQAVHLINENLSTKPDYLTADPKGKLIPGYLTELAKKLDTDMKNIKIETDNLNTNIQHIKSVVCSQKEISGIHAIQENIFIKEAIDSALIINDANFENKGIIVRNELQENFSLTVDKTKLLQILINIIKNAKESVLLSPKNDKVIIISVQKNNSYCEVKIHDNGVGISKENLTKIFSFGHTTKIDGHGFGLHSCANAATELGGSLSAYSDGVEKGATFILKLPLEKIKNGVRL